MKYCTAITNFSSPVTKFSHIIILSQLFLFCTPCLILLRTNEPENAYKNMYTMKLQNIVFLFHHLPQAQQLYHIETLYLPW